MEPMGNLLLAGCVDGSIGLFDRRIGPEKGYDEFNFRALAVFADGSGYVLNAKFSSSDCTEFMSGTSSGDILLWDIRQSMPILKVETIPGPKPFFQIHEQAPLMAW